MKILRVTTELWISAYRKKLEKEGIPFYFYKKGDYTAGAILIKFYSFDGEVELFHRVIDSNGKQKWELLLIGSEQKIDNAIKRQSDMDPDIWVLAIDDPSGKNYLNDFDEL